MKKINIIFIIFISFFVFKTHSVFAANLSLTAPTTVNTGDRVDMTVTADTGGVSINSAELVVSYDQNTLSFTGYSDDTSVIKLWIDPPHAETNNENQPTGRIDLSGIIPGGVNGLYDPNKTGLSPLPLVHLLFTAKTAGDTQISFASSEILEDDGLGTPLPHDTVAANIDIKNNPNNSSASTNQNIISNKTNNTVQNSPLSSHASNLLFWIVMFVLISGILGYKLIKYKA